MTLTLRQRLRSRALCIPHLHLEPAPESCGKCRTCETRCPMSLDVSTMVASGSMYNAECILCGSCVDGCPKGAIQHFFKTPAGAPREHMTSTTGRRSK